MSDLQCIGIKRTGQRCESVSPTDPPYPEHPLWPYLCVDCASEPSRGGSRNSRGIVEFRPKTA
jgi:hypothetical protein